MSVTEYPFPLDRGYLARLMLPAEGITARDAERLIAFIRTLVAATEEPPA